MGYPESARGLKVLLVLLAFMVIGCEKEPVIMVLPGQENPASELLHKALEEVRARSGRRIEICDITQHPNPPTRTARGHHDWNDGVERIWLSPALARDVQEAVAAHELGHVLQKAGGYCQTATRRDSEGNPVFPELTLLGTTINSLVMDVMADKWALKRGFAVAESLREDAVPRALRDIEKNPDQPEAVNWQEYYGVLERVAEMEQSPEGLTGHFLLPPEVRTQILAVGYAKYKLRFEPLGLFEELDRRWEQNRPKARALGNDIVSLVKNTGYDTREECEASMIAAIEFLKIPPPLIIVKRPLTGEIVWPKS